MSEQGQDSGSMRATDPPPLAPGQQVVRRQRPSPQSRLTVTGNVYFQSPDEQPVTIPLSYSASVESKEEPYRRTVTVDSEWSPIDLGWINWHDVGYVALTSRAPADGSVVQIGVETVCGDRLYTIAVFELLPGMTLAGLPYRAAELRLRAVRGPVKVSLLVVPR